MSRGFTSTMTWFHVESINYPSKEGTPLQSPERGGRKQTYIYTNPKHTFMTYTPNTLPRTKVFQKMNNTEIHAKLGR